MGKERPIDQSSYSEGVAGQDAPLTSIEGDFVKDAKKVISGHLARTVLVVSAVLAGAGIIAVEKAEAYPTANCERHIVVWCDVVPSMNWTVIYNDYVGGLTTETFVVDYVGMGGCHVSGPWVNGGGDSKIIIESYGGPNWQNPQHSCITKSVGGIAESPDLSNLPQNMTSEKSKDYTLPIAAGVVGATGAIAAAGALLYSRRNRSAK